MASERLVPMFPPTDFNLTGQTTNRYWAFMPNGTTVQTPNNPTIWSGIGPAGFVPGWGIYVVPPDASAITLQASYSSLAGTTLSFYLQPYAWPPTASVLSAALNVNFGYGAIVTLPTGAAGGSTYRWSLKPSGFDSGNGASGSNIIGSRFVSIMIFTGTTAPTGLVTASADFV